MSKGDLELIAIIPCAGRGTRRQPETIFSPKILLDYNGEPLIEHIVRPIDTSGCFEKIILVLNLKHGHSVIDYVRRHPFKTPVKFVWQPEPLGFGHAVLMARNEVFSGRRWKPPILIHTDDAVNTHPDPDKNLVTEIAASEVSQIGVSWRGNVKNYGMVIVRSDDNGDGIGSREASENQRNQETVLRFIEKPYWDQGGLAITGIYYIRESRRLFRCLNKLIQTQRTLNGEYQFTHALQMMIDGGLSRFDRGTPFRTYYHDWVDCGKAVRSPDRPLQRSF